MIILYQSVLVYPDQKKHSIVLLVSTKTFSAIGIVLKRVSVGETDRIVNILTQEFGKLTCVAKGVRKITSTKRAFLEPGNVVKGFFIETKSLPLLTQATLIEDCSLLSHTLQSFRQLSQLLEIYEKLFVETEIDTITYQRALKLRKMVVENKATTAVIKETLSKIITELGFQHPTESKYTNISDYVSALSDSKIKSFDYLRVK